MVRRGCMEAGVLEQRQRQQLNPVDSAYHYHQFTTSTPYSLSVTDALPIDPC